jgi:hypothetical protein
MTKKLLNGTKTKIILKAPDFRKGFSRVILDNKVYEVDKYFISACHSRLPIPLGLEVAISRTYGDYIREGKINPDNTGKRDNRKYMVVSELKEAFIATRVEIKPFKDVTLDEWRKNGYDMEGEDDESLKTSAQIIFSSEFGLKQLPNYVYVFDFRLVRP